MSADVLIDHATVTFRSLRDTVHVRARALDMVSGLVTARGNGTVSVIATLDSTAKDTTEVTVTQRLTRFDFAPVNLVLDALNLHTVVTVIPLRSLQRGGAGRTAKEKASGRL